MFNICIAHFTYGYDQIHITLFKKYNIKTKESQNDQTSAMTWQIEYCLLQDIQ